MTNFHILLKTLYFGAVWIWIILPAFASTFVSFFLFAPLFLTFQPITVHSKISIPVGSVYGIRTTNFTFQLFFIKNRFYGTIHTFKNYFATMFSVFNFNKLFCLLIFERTFLSLNYCGKVLFSLYIYIYIYI